VTSAQLQAAIGLRPIGRETPHVGAEEDVGQLAAKRHDRSVVEPLGRGVEAAAPVNDRGERPLGHIHSKDATRRPQIAVPDARRGDRDPRAIR
jgi:hypothetical protein